MLGYFEVSEPGTGSDIASMRCRARKDGDSFLLTGNKYWCTFADGADYLMVMARTSEMGPNRRHLGISMFIIPKKRGELPPGVNGAPIPKIGYFCFKTWEFAFDNLRVAKENLIGEVGKAVYYATSWLGMPPAPTASPSIGLA